MSAALQSSLASWPAWASFTHLTHSASTTTACGNPSTAVCKDSYSVCSAGSRERVNGHHWNGVRLAMRYHERPAHANGDEHKREHDRLTATEDRVVLALARHVQRHGEDDPAQHVTVGIGERHVSASSGVGTVLQRRSLTPRPSLPNRNPGSARQLEVDNARSSCAGAEGTEQLALLDLGSRQASPIRSPARLGYGMA